METNTVTLNHVTFSNPLQVSISPGFIENFNKNYRIKCNRMLPGVDRVIYQGTKTIVKWTDGSTTIVDCVDGDIFDKETGLAMAIARKYFYESRSAFKYCVENAKTYDKPKK